MAGRPQKEFHEYLAPPNRDKHVSHEEYLSSPATAVLKYSVEAKSAADLCIRRFKNDGENYSPDALDSLQHIVTAMLPAIMGHFETYQRYLFAGVFELSPYLRNFNDKEFFQKLGKQSSFAIDPVRLAAYRGQGPSSIGVLLSDALPGWHAPGKVNSYFTCFGLNFFSDENCSRLSTLWQLRHSIVHTGGTLTLADSQKVSSLSAIGESQIAFENHFIYEVSRKLHKIVKESTNSLEAGFRSQMVANVNDAALRKIERLFEVGSSHSAWLR
ncbi:hypothetical protein SAMN05421509_105275 [Chromohalobacter canadensis]|uniref:Uncharacterized protein n=1 Tax=Chromohalobacter canadensis TaxID=141389 RepID=A0A285VNR9_9GAMM|nr:hypothetical protein [Chromohalobacter canadensis]SOC55702.1 hypothetical protein SAMN05421509_105275 [Chromohalobacter canadensis]